MARKASRSPVGAATQVNRVGLDGSMGHSARGKDLKWRALDYIREHIFSGEFPPGSLISALGIAKRLNTETGKTWSRSPVREAMEILASEGLIQWRGIAGAQVLTVDKQGLWDTLVLRFAIETQVALRVAKEHDPLKIGILRNLLQEMKDFNDRLVVPAPSARASEWDKVRWEHYALDKAFHITMAELSGIRRADAYVSNQLDHLLLYATQHSAVPGEVYNEHKKILDAIEEYDPAKREESVKAVKKAIKDHMENTAKRWAFGLTPVQGFELD